MTINIRHWTLFSFSLVLIYVLTAFRPGEVLASATLSLSPATKSVLVGETFGVDVLLDTGGDAVSGATTILTYDPTKLLVIDDVTGSDTTSEGINILPGTIFNQTPLKNTVDETTGKIEFDSGSLGSTYNSNGGRGIMATVHFKALDVGTANVNFVFNATETVDTSLVASAAVPPENLLTSVNNGTYTISAATSSSRTRTLPNTGALENTLAFLGAGLALIVGGVFLGRKAFGG